jgi:hypothetical protein
VTSLLKMMFIAIAAIVMSSYALAQSPYLPLARAQITASGDDVDRLLNELREFARAQKLIVREGNFPKQGQQVVNIGLYFGVGRDSHFIINNFRQQSSFELISYSHDDEVVWRPPWNALLDQLRSRLGANRVSIIIP